MKYYFAQTTQLPNTGASNAQDFQPPTRNPQTAPGNLQPVTNSQQASPQDVLSQTNTRIIVPTNPADPPQRTQQVNSGSINWIFVIVATAAIVFIVERFFRRREAVKSQVYIQKEYETYDPAAAPEEVQEEPPEPVAQKSASEAAPAAKTVKVKKKKSKSKRKNR